MKFACKFVCANSYDFTDKDGKRIMGTNAYCFDTHTNNIVKAKVVSSAIEGKKFGDDITVTAIPNGRFIKYEV